MIPSIYLFLLGTFLLCLITALVVMIGTGTYLYTTHLLSSSTGKLSNKALYKSISNSNTYIIVCDSVSRTAYGSTYFVTINDYYINYDDNDDTDSLVVTKRPKLLLGSNLNYLIVYLRLITGYTFTAVDSSTGEVIDLKKLY